MSEAPSGDGPAAGHGRVARIAVAITATLSLLIGVGSAYGFVAYRQAGAEGTNPRGEWIPPSAEGSTSDDPRARDVCNYLLLGSDSRAGLTPEERDQFGTDEQIGGENRADTIMLVHTETNLEKAIILSFPRSGQIPGHGWDKINAAFEGGLDGGGPLLMAKTVQKLTGLLIDHTLYVDLAGFQGLVETLGGVDMCISSENVNTPGSVSAPEVAPSTMRSPGSSPIRTRDCWSSPVAARCRPNRRSRTCEPATSSVMPPHRTSSGSRGSSSSCERSSTSS